MLKDKLNPAVEFDLSEGLSYNFSSEIATATTDRFSLIFRAPDVTTNLINVEKLKAQVFANAANQITIIAPEKCNYAIYNATGQKQYENSITSTKTTINKTFGAGVYFVALSINGQGEIQKVVIR